MDLRSHWSPVPGYLDAASMGLPPRVVLDAMTADLNRWRLGDAYPVDYDAVVQRAREAFARVVTVAAERVAVGPQVSVLVGLVAASVPHGARVVVPTGEFTSVTYPFLVHDDRDVIVEHVPLAGLADAVRPGVDVVAFSLAQSADGTVADADAILAAAADTGTIVVADLTQAVGWLPVDASRFDATVTGAYKWLCAPRGSAFLTVAPQVARAPAADVRGLVRGGERVGLGLRAGDGPGHRRPAVRHLAGVARVGGYRPAVELFAGWLDDPATAAVVTGHGARLADRVREALDLPAAGRPVVALPDPEGRPSCARGRRLPGRGAGRAGADGVPPVER